MKPGLSKRSVESIVRYPILGKPVYGTWLLLYSEDGRCPRVDDQSLRTLALLWSHHMSSVSKPSQIHCRERFLRTPVKRKGSEDDGSTCWENITWSWLSSATSWRGVSSVYQGRNWNNRDLEKMLEKDCMVDRDESM